jgi:hypothetical protein
MRKAGLGYRQSRQQRFSEFFGFAADWKYKNRSAAISTPAFVLDQG